MCSTSSCSEGQGTALLFLSKLPFAAFVLAEIAVHVFYLTEVRRMGYCNLILSKLPFASFVLTEITVHVLYLIEVRRMGYHNLVLSKLPFASLVLVNTNPESNHDKGKVLSLIHI